MNIFYDYYIDVIKSKYLKFEGRSSRSEFWYFMLFNFIITSLLSIFDTVLNIQTLEGLSVDEGVNIGVLTSIYTTLTLVPWLLLHFRRLHDIGKSAWWMLIVLVPVLGFFILLYFFIKAGDKEHNKYGSSPLNTIHNVENNNSEDEIPRNMLMEDSDNAGKSKKIVKFIGITLLVVFVIGGGIFFAVSAGLFSMGQAIMESANSTHIENKIEQKNGMIEITLPLEEQYALHYENLNLCTPESKSSEMFFKRVDAGDFGASTMCSNGVCSVSIGLENNTEYPKSILAYVQEGGLCQQKRITTVSKPVVENHEALVEMTPQLLEVLGVDGDKYSVSVRQSQSSNAWQLLGTKKVAFYYENPLSSDDLMIDGIKKAKLIYIYKNTNQVVQAPRRPTKVITSKIVEAKTIKPKKMTLEEEKRALEKELKSLQEEEAQALKDEKEALEKELKALIG